MSHYDEQYDKWMEGGLCPPSSFPPPPEEQGVKRKVPDSFPTQEEGYINTTETVVVDKYVMDETELPFYLPPFIRAFPKGSNTVLAGGALRDIAQRENVSDWDLFTRLPFQAAVTFLRTHKDVEQNSVVQLTSEFGGPDYQGAIRYVLEFNVEGLDEPVQLIGVDNVHKHIQTEFPVGASRCSFDGYLFRYTMSFARDMHRNTFTILNANTLTQKYIHKMKLKYPEWEWKV